MEKYFSEVIYRYAVDLIVPKSKTKDLFIEVRSRLESVANEYHLNVDSQSGIPKNLVNKALAYRGEDETSKLVLSANIVKDGDVYVTIVLAGEAVRSDDIFARARVVFEKIIKLEDNKRSVRYSELAASARGAYVSSDSTLAHDSQWLDRINKLIRPRSAFADESESISLKFSCNFKEVFSKTVEYEPLVAKEGKETAAEHALGISIDYDYEKADDSLTLSSVSSLIRDLELDRQLELEGESLDKLVSR